MALRLRAGSRDPDRVRVAVSDPGATVRSRVAGVALGARPAAGPAAATPVSPDGHRVAVRGDASAFRRRSSSHAYPAAPRECVIAALFVFAAVLLVVPAFGRIGRRVRLGADGDVPMRLLALTVAGLSEHHREWAEAMSAELAAVSGAGPRWRFSVGCARAAG